jgi:hypothetical protein
MSCTREILPTPIAPMLIRFEGAVAPKTLRGTMVGNPDARAPATVPLMKARLVELIDTSRDIDSRL